jgi:hypothetical protein
MLKQNLMKIRQWEHSCSIRRDGGTDITKLIVAFRNSAKAPKMWKCMTIKRSSISASALFFLNVPTLRQFSFRYQQRVEEATYGVLVQ